MLPLPSATTRKTQPNPGGLRTPSPTYSTSGDATQSYPGITRQPRFRDLAKWIKSTYGIGSTRVSRFSRSYTQPSSLRSPVAVRAATHGWVFRFVSC